MIGTFAVTAYQPYGIREKNSRCLDLLHCRSKPIFLAVCCTEWTWCFCTCVCVFLLLINWLKMIGSLLTLHSYIFRQIRVRSVSMRNTKLDNTNTLIMKTLFYTLGQFSVENPPTGRKSTGRTCKTLHRQEHTGKPGAVRHPLCHQAVHFVLELFISWYNCYV